MRSKPYLLGIYWSWTLLNIFNFLFGSKTFKCCFSTDRTLSICLHGKCLSIKTKQLLNRKAGFLSWRWLTSWLSIIVLNFDILLEFKSRISEILAAVCICGFFPFVFSHYLPFLSNFRNSNSTIIVSWLVIFNPSYPPPHPPGLNPDVECHVRK